MNFPNSEELGDGFVLSYQVAKDGQSGRAIIKDGAGEIVARGNVVTADAHLKASRFAAVAAWMETRETPSDHKDDYAGYDDGGVELDFDEEEEDEDPDEEDEDSEYL